MSMHDHVDNLILNPAVSFAVHCTAAPAAKAAAPKAVAAKTAKAAPAPAKDADSDAVAQCALNLLAALVYSTLASKVIPAANAPKCCGVCTVSDCAAQLCPTSASIHVACTRAQLLLKQSESESEDDQKAQKAQNSNKEKAAAAAKPAAKSKGPALPSEYTVAGNYAPKRNDICKTCGKGFERLSQHSVQVWTHIRASSTATSC
eukprot:12213-Heterococcus_DN1.PRE.2